MSVQRSLGVRSQWHGVTLVGVLAGAMAVTGCNSGTPTTGQTRAGGATQPPVLAQPVKRGKVDVSSRRQHQLQTGQAPPAK